VRALTGTIESYDAPSTEEIARRVGLQPDQIIRFDGNTSPQALPSTRAEALTEELGRIHTYPHGGYPQLERAIADYAGVAPENVVLGAGADDLILLVTRSFASPGDNVAIANDPTYPMFPISVWIAGAHVSEDNPVLTICCRPNNPTGELGELPASRPLVVDEAYFEYSGATAVDLIEGVRPRRRARRLRARRTRRRCGAEQAAASGAALDPLRRTRARRSRGAPRRHADPGGARTNARAATRARLRAARIARELPLRARRASAGRVRPAAAARAGRAAGARRHSHHDPQE
jgi:hypothetical protein